MSKLKKVACNIFSKKARLKRQRISYKLTTVTKQQLQNYQTRINLSSVKILSESLRGITSVSGALKWHWLIVCFESFDHLADLGAIIGPAGSRKGPEIIFVGIMFEK